MTILFCPYVPAIYKSSVKCSIFYRLFKLVVCVFINKFESSLYTLVTSLSSDMFCKYFLLVYGLFFNFLECLYIYIDCVSSVIAKKFLPKTRSKRFLFSSRCFIILFYINISDPFQVIIWYMTQGMDKGSLFAQRCPIVSKLFIEKTFLSPLNYLGTSVKNQMTIFVNCLFCSTDSANTKLS